MYFVFDLLYHSSNILDDTDQESHLEISSKSTVEKLKPPFLVFISLSKGHAVPILFSTSDLARFLFNQTAVRGVYVNM